MTIGRLGQNSSAWACASEHLLEVQSAQVPEDDGFCPQKPRFREPGQNPKVPNGPRDPPASRSQTFLLGGCRPGRRVWAELAEVAIPKTWN
jgi:hypothetical protein